MFVLKCTITSRKDITIFHYRKYVLQHKNRGTALQCLYSLCTIYYIV